MQLEPLQWVLVLFGGMCVGLNKAGLMGTATINVVIMASLFTGVQSAGIVLPMLIIADVFAVAYYRRHAEWKVVARLIPWAVLGIVIGAIVGARLPDEWFRRTIAVFVLGSVGLMVFQEIRGREIKVEPSFWVSALLGTLAGFVTMVGNAAGPLMALYLFSMGFEKNRFIGTAAWYFLIVNVLKVPLHIFVWESITWESFRLDLIASPAIIAGVGLGLLLVRAIPERPYRFVVLTTTAIISLRLLLV